MWWLIALIIVIAAFAVPRFGIALLVLVAIGGIVLLVTHERQVRETEASKRRLSPQDVQFSDLRLGQAYRGSSTYRLTGRLRNASTRFSLKSIELRIVISDCIGPENCDVVGDSVASMFVDVPPTQSRGIDDTVYFTNVPAFRGAFSWSYTLAEVRAE